MNNNTLIVPTTKHHLKELARQRILEPNSGFVPLMGENFFQILLKVLSSSRYGMALTCIDKTNNEILGFVMATLDMKKLFNDIVIKAGLKLLFVAALRVVKNPKL